MTQTKDKDLMPDEVIEAIKIIKKNCMDIYAWKKREVEVQKLKDGLFANSSDGQRLKNKPYWCDCIDYLNSMGYLNTRANATTQSAVDVEGLKWKVSRGIAPENDHTNLTGTQMLLINKILDYLNEQGYLRTPEPTTDEKRAMDVKPNTHEWEPEAAKEYYSEHDRVMGLMKECYEIAKRRHKEHRDFGRKAKDPSDMRSVNMGAANAFEIMEGVIGEKITEYEKLGGV